MLYTLWYQAVQLVLPKGAPYFILPSLMMTNSSGARRTWAFSTAVGHHESQRNAQIIFATFVKKDSMYTTQWYE